MGTDFWGGFWLGGLVVAMLWGFASRSKPSKPMYRWAVHKSDNNWHPDYVEPRKAPRVLKKMGKK